MSRQYHARHTANAATAQKRYRGSKLLFRELSDWLVYIIDGTGLRREIDDQFIMGSNHNANPEYIPEGEIWLEEMLTPAERFFICLHEVVDARHMMKGLTYEQAHKIASRKESAMRKKWKNFRFLGADWPVSLELPQFHPKQPKRGRA